MRAVEPTTDALEQTIRAVERTIRACPPLAAALERRARALEPFIPSAERLIRSRERVVRSSPPTTDVNRLLTASYAILRQWVSLRFRTASCHRPRAIECRSCSTYGLDIADANHRLSGRVGGDCLRGLRVDEAFNHVLHVLSGSLLQSVAR